MFGALRFGFGNLPNRNVRAKAASSSGSTSGMSPMAADAKTALLVGLTLAAVPPAIGYPASKRRFEEQEAAWKRSHPTTGKGRGKATETKAVATPVATETVKPVEEVKAPAPAPAASVASTPAKAAKETTVKADKEENKWVKPTVYSTAGAAVGAAMLVALIAYEKKNGKGNKPAASAPKAGSTAAPKPAAAPAPKPAPTASTRA